MSQAADQIQQVVQRALSEFESLAASELAPSNVMTQMITTLCRATAATAAVAWMPNRRDNSQMAVARCGQAKIAFAENGLPHAAVLEAVEQAAAENKPAVVAPEQAAFAGTELAQTTQFFVPMDAAGHVMGVMQIIHPAQLDPKVYRQYIAFTQHAARAAGVYLARRQSQVLAEESASTTSMLKVVGQLLSENKPHDVIHELANSARPMLQAQRVAVIGYWRRKSDVQFSDAVDVNRKAVLVRAVEMLADTVRQREVPMTFIRNRPLDEEDDAMGSLLEDIYSMGAAQVVCLTLIRHEDRVVGVMVAEYADIERADQFTPNQQTICQQAGPILDRAIAMYYRPLRRTSSVLGALRDRPLSFTAKIIAGIVLVMSVLYGVFFVPAPMYVRADARLEPARLGVITAPVEGRVEKVVAQTGQTVKAGDLLAKIDDTDINLKLVEVGKAIGGEQVKLEAARAKGDAPSVRSSELRIDQLNIRRRILERDQARTEVRSLIDGVVLTERMDQLEGQTVSVGDSLVHVADLSRFELVMEVREEDLALIEHALRSAFPVGVDFLSRPWPDLVQHATITDITALSPTSGPDEANQQHVFRISVPIELKNMSPQLVLANPTGRAKLQVEPASLAYRYGRRVWRFIQMTLMF